MENQEVNQEVNQETEIVEDKNEEPKQESLTLNISKQELEYMISNVIERKISQFYNHTNEKGEKEEPKVPEVRNWDF